MGPIMILNIYCDKRFTERLEALRRQGGKSLAVAKKADRLVKRILAKGGNGLSEVGKLTNHGELRIKRCKKYDLGDGYRLICLEEGNQIVLLYIGTHDECSRWLERNKGLQYEIDEKNVNFLAMKEMPSTDLSYQHAKDPADEYEEQLMAKIDDKILRKIFCGLCE
jgi:hypothetical protein